MDTIFTCLVAWFTSNIYNIAGVLGAGYLLIFFIWFLSKPISRDQLLVSFGKKYFWHVFFIMVSCTAVIAAALSMDRWGQIDSNDNKIRAIQFALKMVDAKDAKLNVGAFVFIMLFQVVVFEGLVLATIVGWTGRRAKRYQNGEVRYEPFAFTGVFRRYNYAVVIGANEVAPSVIKNLLMHEDKKKNSLNYAHEEENQYVILQTSSDVEEVRQSLKSYLTKNEYDRVIIYSDLRNSYEGITALHLEDASEIYVLGENTTIDGGETYHDTMNMRCVNIIADVLGAREDKKVCKVLFEYQTTYSVFQFSDISKEVNDAMHFIPFNRYDSWARRVMVDNKALALIDENDKGYSHNGKKDRVISYTPLDGYEGIKYEDDKRVHFIVVGMSKMGVAMGVQALFQAHYPNYVRDNSLKSRITFIDANAEQEMQFFKGRYATLFELARHRYLDASLCKDYNLLNTQNECTNASVSKDYMWVDPMKDNECKWKHLNKNLKDDDNFLDVEIEFVKGELESECVREYLRQVTIDKRSKTTIAICLPLTHQSVAAALYMPLEVYNNVQEIWVYQREAADIIENLTHSIDNNIRYRKLKPFGMLYGEYIDNRTHYLKALLVDGAYNMDGEYKAYQRDFGKKDLRYTYRDLRESWNSLSVSLKWSNKYFADSIYQKARCVMTTPKDERGCVNKNFFKKDFYDTIEWYKMLKNLILQNKEVLARCEHNRWNVQQLLMGYMPCGDEELSVFATLNQLKESDAGKQRLQSWRTCVNWKTKNTIQQKALKDTVGYYTTPTGKYDKKKKDLKNGIYHIHPNICCYDDLSIYDKGAQGYDEYLNKVMPEIILLVDGYGSKAAETWRIEEKDKDAILKEKELKECEIKQQIQHQIQQINQNIIKRCL